MTGIDSPDTRAGRKSDGAAPHGCLITFEGPEGCGKSTHAARLAERIRASGREVIQIREPGGTAIGEAVRHLLQHDTAGDELCAEAELLLFEASRAQLTRDVIKPALGAGKYVICDRFYDSTVAYQGYGRGLDVNMINSLNSVAVDGVRPDLTLLLDISIEKGFQRLEERSRETNAGKDRMERESLAFHEVVRKGYLEIAGDNSERFRIIDADAAMDEVAERIWRAVSSFLGETQGQG